MSIKTIPIPFKNIPINELIRLIRKGEMDEKTTWEAMQYLWGRIPREEWDELWDKVSLLWELWDEGEDEDKVIKGSKNEKEKNTCIVYRR